MNPNLERIQGFIRHAITGLGGALVSLGITTDTEQWATIAGAVVTVVGIVWSWLAPEKKEV